MTKSQKQSLPLHQLCVAARVKLMKYQPKAKTGLLMFADWISLIACRPVTSSPTPAFVKLNADCTAPTPNSAGWSAGATPERCWKGTHTAQRKMNRNQLPTWFLRQKTSLWLGICHFLSWPPCRVVGRLFAATMWRLKHSADVNKVFHELLSQQTSEKACVVMAIWFCNLIDSFHYNQCGGCFFFLCTQYKLFITNMCA